MLKLDLGNRQEPEWVELLEGVRVLVRPLTSSAVLTATQNAAAMLKAAKMSDGIDAEDGVEQDISTVLGGENQSVVGAKLFARACIIEWEGVGDEDGNPIPVSDDAIDAMIDFYPIYEAFTIKVISKSPLVQMEAEKNGSSPLPNGNLAGAGNTAKPARKSAKPARAKKTRH